MGKRASGQIVNLRLRVRESLRARLEKDARRSGISLNAEVERRLEASHRGDEQEALINHLLGRLLAHGETVAGLVDEWNRLSGRTKQTVIKLEAK
jgi:hypothetical protein